MKVAVEVATPICCGGTAFCTARVSGWKLKPSPRPKKTMTIIVCHRGVSKAMKWKVNRAMVSRPEPMTGKIR